jgi:hypothetical protein
MLVGQLIYESEQQKKISAVLRAEPARKAQVARGLGVSRASLCYKHRLPERDESLRRQIELVMEANPGYGSPRVALALDWRLSLWIKLRLLTSLALSAVC